MANTLWDYYQQQGLPLPSLQERLPLYQQYGIAGTPGSATANTQLLAALQGGQAPQPAPVSSPTAAPSSGGNLFSQYQAQLAPITQQSQDLLKDYYSLASQAPMFEQRLKDEIKKAGLWPSASAMREEYRQDPNLLPMAIESLVSKRLQTTGGKIEDVMGRAYGGLQADIAQKQMLANLAQQQRANLLEEYGLEYQAQQDALTGAGGSGTAAERQASRIRQSAIADAQGGLTAEDLARKYGGFLDDWELIDIYNQHSIYDPMKESPQTFREWTRAASVNAPVDLDKEVFSGPDAAKIGLAETGMRAVTEAKKELFGEDIKEDEVKSAKGSFGKLFGATTDLVPFVQGQADLTPWGRNLQLNLFDAVESLLRLRSGAAVPESEVRRYLKEKGPKLTDRAYVRFNKLQSIQDEFETVMEAMGRGNFTIEEIK
jgi:hypothetical protein